MASPTDWSFEAFLNGTVRADPSLPPTHQPNSALGQPPPNLLTAPSYPQPQEIPSTNPQEHHYPPPSIPLQHFPFTDHQDHHHPPPPFIPTNQPTPLPIQQPLNTQSSTPALPATPTTKKPRKSLRHGCNLCPGIHFDRKDQKPNKDRNNSLEYHITKEHPHIADWTTEAYVWGHRVYRGDGGITDEPIERGAVSRMRPDEGRGGRRRGNRRGRVVDRGDGNGEGDGQVQVQAQVITNSGGSEGVDGQISGYTDVGTDINDNNDNNFNTNTNNDNDTNVDTESDIMAFLDPALFDNPTDGLEKF